MGIVLAVLALVLLGIVLFGKPKDEGIAGCAATPLCILGLVLCFIGLIASLLRAFG
jgi:hypothetical protein